MTPLELYRQDWTADILEFLSKRNLNKLLNRVCRTIEAAERQHAIQEARGYQDSAQIEWDRGEAARETKQIVLAELKRRG